MPWWRNSVPRKTGMAAFLSYEERNAPRYLKKERRDLTIPQNFICLQTAILFPQGFPGSNQGESPGHGAFNKLFKRTHDAANMQIIKGAIFDLDGLLTDTERLSYEAWNNALKPHKVYLSKSDYSALVGKSGKMIAGMLAQKHGLPVKHDELWQDKCRQFDILTSSTKMLPMPHAIETVEFFAARGVKLAVASCTDRNLLDLKLQQAGLEKHFPVTISRGDVERHKPEPDVYLLAAARLGLLPSECIAFEDTLSGVIAAKTAGMACFAIPTELSEAQDFSVADGRFASLRDAVKYIITRYAF